MDKTILPLHVTDLAFSAGGTNLIDGISFALEAGPRTIVLGPNGAGKSLLLRLCHGLIAPSSGEVTWAGANESRGGSDPARRQAMVFQRPVMLRRSVSANVEYALGLRGVSKNARQAQIDEVLSRTGLQRFARTPARVLSFGEQQKLALARAWALNPQVLFLDEPTASLDPAGTRAVEQIIAAIQSGGTKIIMTTHDLGQARRLGDEILFLHQGKLIEKTEAQSFFERPASNLGQAFLNGDLLW
ncbi:MAG: ATP-binding cassette domain-containing protein [Rhodospirillales bacterium]|nr:ATP-binding cassette domain-containing protein [Rhodospirillales bacterium]